MIDLSNPKFAEELAVVKATSAAMLAVRAGCDVSDLRVTEVTNVSVARRLEDPTGQHAVEILVVVGAVGSVYHGPHCRCAAHAAPAPAPAPADPVAPPQADGATHG